MPGCVGALDENLVCRTCEFPAQQAHDDMSTIFCVCGKKLRIPDDVDHTRQAHIEYIKGAGWHAELHGDNGIKISCPECES